MLHTAGILIHFCFGFSERHLFDIVYVMLLCKGIAFRDKKKASMEKCKELFGLYLFLGY